MGRRGHVPAGRRRRLFGEPGETVPDPFFGGGARPARAARCAALHDRLPGRREEHAGQELPRTSPRGSARASSRSDRASSGAGAGRAAGLVSPVQPPGPRAARRTRWRADQVVLAAGTWGTQQLLHRMQARRPLPGLSAALGELTRTNSEALDGAGRRARRPGARPRAGVAITTSFYVDERTHVENVPVRPGSNRWRCCDGPRARRARSTRRLAVSARRARLLRHPVATVRALAASGGASAAHRARHADRSTTRSRSRCAAACGRAGAHERARARASRTRRPPARRAPGREAIAARMSGGGVPRGARLRGPRSFGIPMTAHFLGGAAIGASRARRRRPVPPRVGPPGAARRRRRRRARQPGREPVAHDHRPGRARAVVLAAAEAADERPAQEDCSTAAVRPSRPLSACHRLGGEYHLRHGRAAGFLRPASALHQLHAQTQSRAEPHPGPGGAERRPDARQGVEVETIRPVDLDDRPPGCTRT